MSSSTPAPATLILARHGQTVWHAENRYAGSSDIDLTPTGVEQAGLLAEWAALARPEALYCSPIRRAQETIAPTREALGTAVTTVADLREQDFGVAEGRTIGELAAENPRLVADFRADPVAHHFPGGESPLTVAARGAAALRGIAADNPGRTVLVVAHNTLIRVSLCALIGVPVNTYRAVFPQLSNGTLTQLRLGADPAAPAALLSFNVPIAGEIAVRRGQG
ncbi:histidine phosphatase family protein [Nakamurella silvestris]|nr:histidine phosphatase family protein [Nakamurella silvestris]